MTLCDWTDPRDGRHWTVWLERGGARPILAFAAGDDLHTVVVDFTDGLEGRSAEGSKVIRWAPDRKVYENAPSPRVNPRVAGACRRSLDQIREVCAVLNNNPR